MKLVKKRRGRIGENNELKKKRGLTVVYDVLFRNRWKRYLKYHYCASFQLFPLSIFFFVQNYFKMELKRRELFISLVEASDSGSYRKNIVGNCRER